MFLASFGDDASLAFIMTYFEAVIYGVVQGITEYLPISSSAHLILLPKFMGTQDPGLTFDVFLHMGTLFATLIYFWRDWVGVLRTVPWVGPTFGKNGTHAEVVSWKLIAVATVPALIAGASLHRWVESSFRGNHVLMTTLVVGGILLFASDYYCSRRRILGKAGMADAIWIGIAQCFALIPGISRSGSTITGARLLGFDRASAARFSFLISAPVTFAAVVFELRNWQELLNGPVAMGPLVLAALSAFFAGWMAIAGLLKMIRRFGYFSFALYRVLLAITIFQVLGMA